MRRGAEPWLGIIKGKKVTWISGVGEQNQRSVAPKRLTTLMDAADEF